MLLPGTLRCNFQTSDRVANLSLLPTNSSNGLLSLLPIQEVKPRVSFPVAFQAHSATVSAMWCQCLTDSVQSFSQGPAVENSWWI